MVVLPPHLLTQYRAFCCDNGVMAGDLADYLKWLRYFLDYCDTYLDL